MNTKTRSSATDTTPGFATRLTDETDLGIAMLIAEDDDGELPRGRAGLNALGSTRDCPVRSARADAER
jgi:hypothetical protein